MKGKDILDAIGNTPLVEIPRMSPKTRVRIFAKLEGVNPTGSIKDRIAKYMVENAEKSGELTKDKVIFEPSSGNTAIALAMIGMRKGYRVKLVVPENITPEAKQLIEFYGAEIEFSEAGKGTNGAIKLATEIAAKNKHYYMPFQFGNEANPLAHYETTGSEILQDLPNVDVFIAGLGTGGTLMGTGRRLKEHNSQTKLIAVMPFVGDEVRGLRSLEEGFVPPIVDLSLLDGKMLVRSTTSFLAAKELTKKEGIFAGISSGAVLYCAVRLAQRMEKGNIVVIFADSGWKYLSSGLWTKDFTEIEDGIESKLWW